MCFSMADRMVFLINSHRSFTERSAIKASVNVSPLGGKVRFKLVHVSFVPQVDNTLGALRYDSVTEYEYLDNFFVIVNVTEAF